jgi:hypothetical protein
MPRRNRIFLKALLPLGLLVVAAFALVRRAGDDWEYEQDDPAIEEAPPVLDAVRRHRAARFALAAAFTTLFFAGASFTAGAGDQMARLLDDDAEALAELGEIAAGREAAATDAQPAEAAPAAPAEAAPAEAEAPAAEPAAAVPAPAEVAGDTAPAAEPVAADTAPAAEPTAVEPAAAAPVAAAPENAAAAADAALEPQVAQADQAAGNLVAPAPAEPAASAVEASAPAPAPAAAAKPAAQRVPTKQWVVKRAAAPPARAPEVEHGDDHGAPTVWLNRSLPDPTPASARLARSFAQALAATSKRHGADWAAVLGVLRAQGERGSVPATAAQLNTLASRLAGEKAWKGALAVSGRTSFADRAAALADLYRSVGIEALVTGYEAAKGRLAERLLADERVWIYGGGRDDVAAGRVDVRVIVLIGYLAERHGSVTVSSLFSGHRRFARPGVVSAHVYGHAVDIAAVGGSAIAGNQQPGGLTEAAVRSVLLLPAELQAQQVISLLGLGGPSFPLRDHGDHIHVGF